MAANYGISISIGANLEPFKKALVATEQAIKQTARTAAKPFDGVQAGARTAGRAVDDLGAKVDRFARGADGRLRDTSGRFVKLGEDARDAGERIDRAGKKSRGMAEALERIGAAAAVVSAGLTLTVGAAVNEFAKFEASLNRVKALSGATSAEMEAVSTAALSLGASTKFSAVEASDGIAELVAAGFELSQALTAIPAVLDAAAADAIAVGRAAEISGAVLNGFGLKASEATKVVDILAQTARVSATSISDMGESMKYASTIAASTSQSIEEVATDLAIMADAGIKGSQGGTVFRSAMASLLKPSDDAGKVLEKLGIALVNTKGKMLPLSDILGQLRDKTAGMGEAQRGAAVATIFGQEALSGVLAIMKLTEQQMAKTAAEIRNYDGAARETASTMNKGIIPAVEEAKGAISSLAIVMGESFAPAVGSVAQGANDIATELGKLPAPVRTVVALLASGTLVFAAGAGALSLYGGAATLAAAGVTALGTAGRFAFPILGALSLAIGAVVAAKDLEARSEREASVQRQKAQQEALKEVSDNRARKEALADLAAEHDRLAGKTRLSKAEKQRLMEVQAALAKEIPGFAAAVQNSADKHHAAARAAAEETRRLDENTAARIRNARVRGVELAAEVARETGRVPQLLADAQAAGDDAGALGDSFGGPGVGGLLGSGRGRQAVRARGAADAQVAKVAGLVQQKRENDAFLKKLEEAAKPPVIKKTETDRGDAYDHKDKGGGRGGKGAAEKAAAKAAAEAKKRLDDQLAEMAERYAILERMGQAFGTGRAGQVEVKQEYVAELKLKGLDKYAEGQKVARGLAADITILNHEIAKEASEKGAAAIKARIDLEAQAGTEQQDAAVRRAEAQVALLTGIERERAEVDLANAAQLRANRAAYDQAETKAAALAFAEGATEQDQKQAEALLVGAKAARQVADAAAAAGRQDKLAKLAHEATTSYLRMADTLIDLASDPSLDKLAGTLERLAGDPEEMKRWGQAAEAAKNLATSGWDGLTKGLATGDAMALTMWGVAKAIQGAQAAWEYFSSTSGATAINEAFSGASESIAQINNRLRHGLITESEAAKGKVDTLTAALGQLVTEQATTTDAAKWNNLEAAIAQVNGHLTTATEQWAALAVAEGRATGAADEAADAMGRALSVAANRDRLGLDTDLETAEANLSALKEAMSSYAEEQATTSDPTRWAELEQKIGDLKPALAAAETQVKQLGKAAEDAKAAGEAFVVALDKGPTVGELADKWADGIKKLVDLRGELNEGERDDWGRKTTIAARALLDLTKERAAWTRRAAGFADQETKAIAEKARIERERDAAIRDILDEGIAVRAKSEAQDKTERIEKVRAEAAEKLKAQDEAIARVRTEREEEKLAHDQRMSQIRIQAEERLEAIAKERGALVAQLEDLRTKLDITSSIADAEERAARARLATKLSQLQAGGAKGAPGFASDGRKSGFSGGEITGAALRELDATLRLQKFHTGGLIPGPDGREVPIIAQGGERVLTKEHQDWLASARAVDPGLVDYLTNLNPMVSLPPGYASGNVTNVNLGGITVKVDGILNDEGMARRIGRIAMDQIDARLKRAGHGLRP